MKIYFPFAFHYSRTLIRISYSISISQIYSIINEICYLSFLDCTFYFLCLLSKFKVIHYFRKYVYSVIMKNRRLDKTCNRSSHSDEPYSSRVNNFSFMRAGLQKPFQAS